MSSTFEAAWLLSESGGDRTRLRDPGDHRCPADLWLRARLPNRQRLTAGQSPVNRKPASRHRANAPTLERHTAGRTGCTHMSLGKLKAHHSILAGIIWSSGCSAAPYLSVESQYGDSYIEQGQVPVGLYVSAELKRRGVCKIYLRRIGVFRSFDPKSEFVLAGERYRFLSFKDSLTAVFIPGTRIYDYLLKVLAARVGCDE